MADFPRTSSSGPDPDPILAALLAALLADALRAETSRAGTRRTSDEGRADEGWADGGPDAGADPTRAPLALPPVQPAAADLLADEDLRALVTDVAWAEGWAEAHAEAGDEAGELPAAARAAALAAFDATLVGASNGANNNGANNNGASNNGATKGRVPATDAGRVRTGRPATTPPHAGPARSEPLRAARFRPLPFVRTGLAAAAVVLLALGAVIFLGATDRDAEAGLQLNALARLDLAGSVRMSSIEPGYFARLGHVFTPGRDELLSFGFGHDAMLVVGGGDAVRVTRSALLADVLASLDAPGETEAVLRLESGEARLATRERPVLLALGDAGLLVLLEGAAHVAFHADAFHAEGAGAPVVALAERSQARFHPVGGAPVPLAGPTRVQLAPSGPQAFGTPARSLFRDLEFFGGPLPRPTRISQVSARLWAAEGSVLRGRTDIRVVPTPGAATATARLAWRAPHVLASATTLRVALRAPAGTRVALPALDVQGVVAARGQARPSEPGVATVEIPLPRGWYERLERRMLRLVIEVPATGTQEVVAWFDGVSLVLAEEDPGAGGGAAGEVHGG